MSLTEGLEAISERIDSFWLGADDHSEEATLKEALAWESEAVLLMEELLAEVDIIFDVFEAVKLNLDHHVHGCTASDWDYTVNRRQPCVSRLRGQSELLFHRFKVRARDLLENFWQRELYN